MMSVKVYLVQDLTGEGDQMTHQNFAHKKTILFWR